jgi:hypothetical protein
MLDLDLQCITIRRKPAHVSLHRARTAAPPASRASRAAGGTPHPKRQAATPPIWSSSLGRAALKPARLPLSRHLWRLISRCEYLQGYDLYMWEREVLTSFSNFVLNLTFICVVSSVVESGNSEEVALLIPRFWHSRLQTRLAASLTGC